MRASAIARTYAEVCKLLRPEFTLKEAVEGGTRLLVRALLQLRCKNLVFFPQWLIKIILFEVIAPGSTLGGLLSFLESVPTPCLAV